MKRYRTYLVAAVAVLAAAAIWQQTLGQARTGQAQAPVVAAVCDIAQVFNECQQAKDMTSQLDQRKEAARLENQERGKAIDGKRETLNNLTPGSPDYEKQFSEYQRMTIDREAWLKFQEATLLREHHRVTEEMYQNILKVIGQFAKEKGIQIVIYRERELPPTENTDQLLLQIERRKVLYADDALDITDQVLARLNEAYRKGRK